MNEIHRDFTLWSLHFNPGLRAGDDSRGKLKGHACIPSDIASEFGDKGEMWNYNNKIWHLKSM